MFFSFDFLDIFVFAKIGAHDTVNQKSMNEKSVQELIQPQQIHFNTIALL